MSQKMIPDRKDITDEHKWDLSPLFESDRPWEELFTALEKQIGDYHKYKGRLHESVTLFQEAIEFHLGLMRSVEKLYTYAHLKSDEDKADQHYLGYYQRAMNLYTRAAELSSFMTPEIQAVPDDIMQGYLQSESLQEYRFYLDKILRYKPHTLGEAEEQILAMSREVSQAPSQVFGQLDNVDLSFGTITDETGTEVELSHGNFTTFLINPDRDIRKLSFFQYYQAYADHKLHQQKRPFLRPGEGIQELPDGRAVQRQRTGKRVRQFNQNRAQQPGAAFQISPVPQAGSGTSGSSLLRHLRADCAGCRFSDAL
jgi:oligoendopeptidase F